MFSSKMIKWSVAVAAAGMVSAAAIPAVAAHVSRKSGATTRPSHNLAAVMSPGVTKTHKLTASHAKTHKLSTLHAKTKKLSASTGKHLVKHHPKVTAITAAAHKHSAKSLDKSKKTLSNM